jgi:hypothetical protein
MKTLIIILAFFGILLQSSFAQNWFWANSGGSIYPHDGGNTICKDATGNVYVGGLIRGRLSGYGLHPYAVFNNDTIQIKGTNDMFVAKYDSNGNQLWVKGFGGDYDNESQLKFELVAQIVYNSHTNSLYLTGHFIGICTFAPHTIFAPGPNSRSIFIAKFDLDGNCIWVKGVGGNDDDMITSLAVTPAGNIYISGSTKYNAVFDTISISNGGFLAKYDDDGKCKWVKNIFNGLNNFPYGAAATPKSIQTYDDDIFVLGQKHSDTVSVDTILLTGTNYYSNILARFDSSGNVKWVKQLGGPRAYGYGSLFLSMDDTGNCYIVNQFRGNYSIFENDTIFAQDTANFFFAKYDKDGNQLWVRQGSCSAIPLYGSLINRSYYSNGNVYFTGCFAGNATFGNFNITANTTKDFFIARYNAADGECLGVVHAGPGEGIDVMINNDGSCLVTGNFGLEQPGQWSLQLGSTTLLTHGYQDFFIAKIDAVITGLYEPKIALNNQLLIYANPSAGKCNVIIPEEFYYEQQLIMNIYDLNGKLLEETLLEINDNTIKLDLEHEASGVYIITLSNGKKVYTGKMIFE